MQSQKYDADEQRHQDSSLLELFVDEQHCAGERQLAAHLHRFPPERGRFIISRQERGSAAQRRRVAGEKRLTTGPQQVSIQHRDTDRPERKHRERSIQCRDVLVRITRQRHIVVKEPSHLISSPVLLKRNAQKCLEDGSRRAWDQKERDD
eukprot:7260770-Prymnesium_polylepis.2